MYFDDKDSFLQPKVKQYGSHMVMTNVHKETKTKFWNIDTRFRDDYDQYTQTITGSQINWYTFTLPQNINDVKSIYVCNVELPISFYNISASLGNNVMKINDSVLTIPDGVYSLTSLRTAFQTQLAALSLSAVVFDISLNGNNLSSFKNTTGSPITLNFAVKSATCNPLGTGVGSTTDFDKYNVKSKLGWLLGFRDITYTINSGVTKYSESVIDINNPKYLYLVIDEFNNANQNSFISALPTSIMNKNILAKISMDYRNYGNGTILPANEYNGLLLSDTRTYSGKVNLQKLKIQLVNEYGFPVNLNGLDFSFCLKIDYE
jgi:hypothetical protein